MWFDAVEPARLAGPGSVHCVNCGAPLAAGDSECRWCASVPSLIDVARLARALDPEGATEAQAVHRVAATASALACLACGAALPGEPALRCPQCAATLATSRLAEAFEQVQAIGPALQAHAERPAPHVVQRRLAANSTDLERRRQWAADLQAEADAQSGAGRGDWRWAPPVSARTALIAAALLGGLWWWWS